jgi:hypothetical protein
MPGLWKHVSCPIWCNLCVDDFGVKYIGGKNLIHLFSTLRTETYKIVEDFSGNLYCGINLKWNYDKHWVDIAMPIYTIKNLTRYNHPPPLTPQHCPYMSTQLPMAKTIKQQLQMTPVHSSMPLAKSASTNCW